MIRFSKFVLLIIALPRIATAADYQPEQKRLSSRVCIERFEDNGILFALGRLSDHVYDDIK